MAVKRNLFPKGTAKKPLKGGGSSTEIDLRAEFDDFIFGGGSSIAHGSTFLLRKMRRGDDGKLISCPCVDKTTYEPDTEDDCPFCLGEGYFWDEEKIIGFSGHLGAEGGKANRLRHIAPGSVRGEFKIFYFRYDTDISYRDKVIDLKLDTEGTPVVPYLRESIYKPQTIIRYRSDNGRVEYLAIYCREDDAIRVDE